MADELNKTALTRAVAALRKMEKHYGVEYLSGSKAQVCHYPKLPRSLGKVVVYTGTSGGCHKWLDEVRVRAVWAAAWNRRAEEPGR